MKQTLAMLGIAVFATTAAAAPPAGKGPDEDMVIGGGKSYSDIFNVAAHSGPNGEAPFGHLQAQNVREFTPPFDIEADVTCMRVNGNVAVIGGRLTKIEAAGYPSDVFIGVLQYLFDGDPTGQPDRISYQYPLTYVPTTCPAPSAVYTIFPLLQGNINIKDQ